VLSFKILGPLEVLRDGRVVDLGPAKQRAVLAYLLLRPGEAVATDRLIDALWGDDPPPSADHQLHVYVSRLRKALGPDRRDAIATRPPGYAVELDPTSDEIDAVVFDKLVREARSAIDDRPADAEPLLDRALAMWRGDLLADLSYETFVQEASARLDELRTVAEEERVTALVSLGRHREALPEIEALVARHPLRERPRELQMVALYRSGRQAEALAAFAAARATLAGQLGIDPSPQLRSLEEAILRHDEAVLGAPAPSAPGSDGGPARPPGGPQRRPFRRRSVVVIGASCAALVAAGILGLVATTTRGPRSGTSSRRRTPAIASTSTPPTPVRFSWALAPSADALGGRGEQVVLGGARTSLGYLGVGYSAKPSSTGPGRDYDAAVWFANQPRTWKRLARDAFGGPGNQRATDAVVFGGRVVVVGIRSSKGGDRDAAVWLAHHPQARWHLVRGLASPGDQVMRDVAQAGADLVAGGFSTGPSGDEHAAVWRSPDGRSWERVGERTLSRSGDAEIDSLVALPGLVVAGGYTVHGTEKDAAVWLSHDQGTTWHRATIPSPGGAGDQQINALIDAGPGLIAVGRRTIDGDVDAAVWLSRDGVTWSLAPDPEGELGGPGAQVMYAVASSSSGIVAGGSIGIGPSSRIAVWTSIDGRSWNRLGGGFATSSFFLGEGQAVKVLMPIPRGILALGDRGKGLGRDAGVWLGRDLP